MDSHQRVSVRSSRSPVVVDTNVFGATLLERTSWLAHLYQPLLAGRPVVISFQTAAELHFGAFRRHWGRGRMLKLETRIATAHVIHSGAELVTTYAKLRADCERVGHALAQRDHDGDRWIAATAIRLGIQIVSHDGIFRDVPGLLFETALDP